MSLCLKGSSLLNEEGYFHGKTGFRKALLSGQLNMTEVVNNNKYVFLTFQISFNIINSNMTMKVRWMRDLIRIDFLCLMSPRGSYEIVTSTAVDTIDHHGTEMV